MPNSLLPAPNADYGDLNNYINGEWRLTTSDSYQDVIDPATGQRIARVPNSSTDDVDQAVTAANEAFQTWATTSVVKRTRPFFELKHLLEENKEDLARSLVQEMGKVIVDARAELLRAIEEIEAACAIPTATRGYHQENTGPDLDLKVTNVPRGVFFMVPSFNFPAMVPLEYLPYAVAARMHLHQQAELHRYRSPKPGSSSSSTNAASHPGSSTWSTAAPTWSTR